MNTSMDPNPISHEDAVRKQMAENFALGQLTREDRERFEAHFFDCDECLENVRLASEFLHHTHRVLPREPEKGAMARLIADLRRPAALVATALFLVACGTGVHQQIQIADLKMPRDGLRVFLEEQTRSPGKEKTISVPPDTTLFLVAALTQKAEFKSYRAQILSEPDKHPKYTVPLHPGANDNSAAVAVPREALPEGSYSLIIQGQQSSGQWKTLEEDKKEAGGVFLIRAHT